MNNKKATRTWRSKLHEVIYEADTPAGKTFDVILLVAILASLAFVMLESVAYIDAKYHDFLFIAEWVITILFSIEYIARIITVKRPLRYIFSFYGIIDLLSTIPMYLSFFFAGSHALIALRSLRLLRVFRVLKLARYLGASNLLSTSLKASRAKIFVFLFAVLIVSIIFGTLMYLIEGADSGFTSIPVSIYWCIVTLTTVGFGDIAPVTPFGQFIAAIIMIMGYGIIAVPTGIISSEYSAQSQKDDKAEDQADHKSKPAEIQMNSQSCYNCNATNHKDEAEFCYNCGHKLHQDE